MKMLRSVLSAALAITLATVAVCCHAQQAAIHVDLQAEALVDGRIVTLGDVAHLNGADASTLDGLRRIPLASAPEPGFSTHLTRREVLRFLREAGSPEVIVDGAEATTVMTQATLLAVGRIVATARESLVAHLGRDGQTLELTPGEALPPVRLPRGEVTLRAREQSADRPRSHMIAWVDILLDGSFYRSVSVPFSVTATQQVLIARTDLRKGQAPDCANLDLAQRDVAPLAAAPQTGDCDTLKRRLRRNLSAGEVLLSSELETIPAVSEGDVVTLEVTEGAVALESRALALTDGEIGQRIPVRATASQEPVLAMIVAPGVVNVSGR